MESADWFVLGVVALAGVYGFTRGLVRGALSLAGFALGAYVGARVAPTVLTEGSPYAPLVALGGALLGGTLLSSLAEMLGMTLRTTMGRPRAPSGRFRRRGAARRRRGGCPRWAIGAALLYLPGQRELRRAVQESAILSRINDEFPPERLLETLERVDPLGVLVGPPAIVAAAELGVARDPDVARAAQSVVRITGHRVRPRRRGLGLDRRRASSS